MSAIRALVSMIKKGENRDVAEELNKNGNPN